MTRKIAVCMLLMWLCAGFAMAQEPPPHHDGQGPPPQAYEDCKGKKAGDTVQHTTPEGKVAAICEESSQGLVARPKQPRNPGVTGQSSQGTVP